MMTKIMIIVIAIIISLLKMKEWAPKKQNISVYLFI